jgi:hypothetical protein
MTDPANFHYEFTKNTFGCKDWESAVHIMGMHSSEHDIALWGISNWCLSAFNNGKPEAISKDVTVEVDPREGKGIVRMENWDNYARMFFPAGSVVRVDSATGRRLPVENGQSTPKKYYIIKKGAPLCPSAAAAIRVGTNSQLGDSRVTNVTMERNGCDVADADEELEYGTQVDMTDRGVLQISTTSGNTLYTIVGAMTNVER